MTFKEKLKKQYPDRVRDDAYSGCVGCPYRYGYEKEEDRPCAPGKPSTTCRACWGREMPGTEATLKKVASTNLIDKFIDQQITAYLNADWVATKSMLSTAKPTLPQIKDVIFNPPATIIFWKDGSKTVVKCQEGDFYNAETGFALAYLKKILGNDNTFNKEIAKWVPEESKEPTEMHDPLEDIYDILQPVVDGNINKVTKKQMVQAIYEAMHCIKNVWEGEQ